MNSPTASRPARAHGLARFGATLALAASILAFTQPAPAADGNPSPLAGFGVSRDANRRADSTMDRQIEYSAKKGPRIIVLPGQVKSNNASFTQRVTANNIADFGELELTRANFTVIERGELGPMQREIELAYTMGDPDQARRLFQKGSLKSTKWIVKFDILKAEQVAAASSGFNGNAVAGLLGALGGGNAANALGRVAGSVNTNEAAGVWVVGMRYKILDANTTEQVASGYAEDKMEMGKASSSVMGVSTDASGQLTLDSLVQRLVQKNVAEIDARYK